MVLPVTSSTAATKRRPPRGARSAPATQALTAVAPKVIDAGGVDDHGHAALLNEIASLRVTLHEVLDAYALRIDGDMAHVADIVSEEPGSLSAEEAAPRIKAIRQARRLLAGLDVKPAKGRRKDLRMIETAVDRLADLVADW